MAGFRLKTGSKLAKRLKGKTTVILPGPAAVFGGKAPRAVSALFKKAGTKAKAAKAAVKRETGQEIQRRVAKIGAEKGKVASAERKFIRSGIKTLRATEGDKAAAKFVRSSQRKVFKPESETGKKIARSFKKKKK